MAEPVWVERIVVDAIHLDQLREHGGLQGIRDENALESSLARARNKWAYEGIEDPAALAAAYGYGITSSHPYRDGNKRIGFLAMIVFLGLNGWDLEATDAEVVATMRGVAAGTLSEAGLAEWVRAHLQPS